MTRIMDIIIKTCATRHITQAELSRRSGVNESAVSRYFRDERTPNLSTAEKMANAIGATLKIVKIKEEGNG